MQRLEPVLPINNTYKQKRGRYKRSVAVSFYRRKIHIEITENVEYFSKLPFRNWVSLYRDGNDSS